MATHSSILAGDSDDRGSWQALVRGAAESDMIELLILSRNQVVETPCLTPALQIIHGAFKYQMLPASLFFKMGLWDFPGGSDGKESAHSAGDQGSIPGLGRCPGGGNGNPLQYSCLENAMDGGSW